MDPHYIKGAPASQPRSDARQSQKSISPMLGGINAKTGFNFPER